MAGFYGWQVVGAAFVLAFFGWGLGFYGPPVYLHAVREARGFSLDRRLGGGDGALSRSARSSPPTFRRFIAASACPPSPRPRRSRSAPACSAGRSPRRRGSSSPRRGQRRRLGRDERRRGQRRGLAVVCARAAGGARHGLQRRELRRPDPLAAVGDRDPVRGLSGAAAIIGVATIVVTWLLAEPLLRAHAGRDVARAGRRHAGRACGGGDVAAREAAARSAAVARFRLHHARGRRGARRCSRRSA